MKKLLRHLIPETSPIRLWWHRSKALAAAVRYGFPARKLTVIGITGTDGKTTTVGMVAHILHENGIAVGALSTAYFRVRDKTMWNATQKTSPSPFVVQKFLRDILDAGCTHAVLECSSHGLLQGRVSFTWPRIAAITNLTEEHLDYHGTMEAYLAAKALLFRSLSTRSGAKVLNVDDRSYEELCDIKTMYTTHTSMERSLAHLAHDEVTTALWATDCTGGLAVSATLHENGVQETLPLELSIAGGFNIQNALTAIACARYAGVETACAAASLRTFSSVPGRMERIPSHHPFTVVVDFTVTPKSYVSTLTTLRTSLEKSARLLVLAGSCGDRMKEKRPIVGEILSRLADVSIITNEDPYTEDPESIIDDVISGMPANTVIYREEIPENAAERFCVRVSDRRKAIRMLLAEARPGDIVLLCGKGSDTTMMTAKGQIPWNEREIVREELRVKNEK